jgi:protease I
MVLHHDNFRTLGRAFEQVLDVVRHFANQGKPIGSICHGQLILSAADVLRGKSR